MEYYIGIVHQGGEEDRRIISTSLRAVSKFTGVSERKLSYRFTDLGKSHYMQLDPWVSVWMVDGITKQERPQYRDNANKMRRE